MGFKWAEETRLKVSTSQMENLANETPKVSQKYSTLSANQTMGHAGAICEHPRSWTSIQPISPSARHTHTHSPAIPPPVLKQPANLAARTGYTRSLSFPPPSPQPANLAARTGYTRRAQDTRGSLSFPPPPSASCRSCSAHRIHAGPSSFLLSKPKFDKEHSLKLACSVTAAARSATLVAAAAAAPPPALTPVPTAAAGPAGPSLRLERPEAVGRAPLALACVPPRPARARPRLAKCGAARRAAAAAAAAAWAPTPVPRGVPGGAARATAPASRHAVRPGQACGAGRRPKPGLFLARTAAAGAAAVARAAPEAALAAEPRPCPRRHCPPGGCVRVAAAHAVPAAAAVRRAATRWRRLLQRSSAPSLLCGTYQRCRRRPPAAAVAAAAAAAPALSGVATAAMPQARRHAAARPASSRTPAAQPPPRRTAATRWAAARWGALRGQTAARTATCLPPRTSAAPPRRPAARAP
eukprot:359320-Chlamydomonas_euryale.AAC.1